MKMSMLMAAMVMAAVTPALAQEPDVTETVEYSSDKYKVEPNTFWNNWFVSVGGGAQVYFGDHDKQCDLGDRLAPALDIAVGKWFTPGIGLRVMYSGLSVKGATKWDDDPNEDSAHGTGEAVPGKGEAPHWLQKSKFNYFNIHLDALLNLSNLLCGYKDGRFYNLSAYAGLGVMSITEEPKETDISAHFGLLNSFRLSNALDLNLDLRGSLVDEGWDGEYGGRGGEGMFTATIGLTYKFKERGWDRSKTLIRTIDNSSQIDALQAELDRVRAEKARLEEALRNCGDRKPVIVANFVVFPINKSTLSNEARVSLGLFADAIKRGDSDLVYTITGYADAGTGTPAINERLSRERAEAVYKCLTEEFGVSKDQLKIDYKGGVENMFYDDPRMSRAVITKTK